MKRIVLFILVGLFFQISTPVEAQILKKITKKVKKKAEQKVDQKVDKTIDKGFDETEKALAKKKADSIQHEKEASKKKSEISNKERQQQQPTASKLTLNWAKYDFVPGDKVIYEDNMVGEENGEFPSRWDLYNGNVENAVFGGDNVIMFRDGAPSIVPYLKNSKTDYLPEIFTVEFDLYLPNNNFTVFFYDRKNQRQPSGSSYLSISTYGMDFSPASSKIPEGKTIKEVWAHIAIAYTNGKLKAYIDETRLINIPHLPFNPSGLTLLGYHANSKYPYLIKNFRMAEGGVKYYDRFLQDGKIVTNGIRFDVNKATIKPESMGVLNSIYKILDDNSNLNFSIEGHTDSDGATNSNQKLSEERAQSVLEKLVSMGITRNRLTSKGFGETVPIDTNGTAEGKANNRRVEFVKS